MALKFDSRQTRQRSKLDQLSTTTDLRLDAIMNLINDELTMPLRMRANLGSGVDGSPDQRLYIDSIFVKTLDSGAADSGHERSRTIPPIGGVMPNYVGSGYIEFNATTGAATASGLTLASSYSLPSMTSGQFVKVVVWLSATSSSVFTFGMEIGVPAASADAAVLPVPPTDAFALGYIVMTKGATTYSKVLNENIFQFVGGGGSGGGSGASKEITQANSFAIGDIVYVNSSGVYVKAQANAANTAEAIGIVSKASASKFTLTELGYITGLSALTPGEVYFLSDSVAGSLTVNEPTTIGSVSKPMLIADSATSGYVLNYRGVVVGGANARTQISLANNATTAVQLVTSYDAGEMAGWVYLQNSTTANSKRFYIQIQFAENGPETDYNVAYQTSGDTPPAGFNVTYSAGYVRITLPNVSGLTSAVFNYALNAPAVGTNFPLSISGNSVTGGTPLVDQVNESTTNNGVQIQGRKSGVAVPAGYVGERVWVNIPSTNGSTTRGVETIAATLSIPSAGIWSIHAIYQRSIILSNNTTGFGCLFDVTIYNGATLLAESREIVANGTNHSLVERTMSIPYYVTTGAASLDLKIRADRWAGTEGFTITSQNIGVNNGTLTGFWAVRIA